MPDLNASHFEHNSKRSLLFSEKYWLKKLKNPSSNFSFSVLTWHIFLYVEAEGVPSSIVPIIPQNIFCILCAYSFKYIPPGKSCCLMFLYWVWHKPTDIRFSNQNLPTQCRQNLVWWVSPFTIFKILILVVTLGVSRGNQWWDSTSSWLDAQWYHESCRGWRSKVLFSTSKSTGKVNVVKNASF